MLKLPSGTIFCLFCRGVVSVKEENFEKFNKHMQDVHEIYYEQEFVLAGSFLRHEEKENIITAARVRIKKSSNVENEIKEGKQQSSSPEIFLAENVEEMNTNFTGTTKNVVEELLNRIFLLLNLQL